MTLYGAMKIYNKGSAVSGIVLFCTFLILAAVGVVEADVRQWVIALAVTGRLLYAGLTKEGSQNAKKVEAHYTQTATTLYGKHHRAKTNLPWIFCISFFAVALVLRFVFDIYLPVGVWVAFAILLTVTVGYSIRVTGSINDYIKNNIPDEEVEI